MKWSVLGLAVVTYLGLPCFGLVKKLKPQDYLTIQSSCDQWFLVYLTSWCWNADLIDDFISKLRRQISHEEKVKVGVIDLHDNNSFYGAEYGLTEDFDRLDSTELFNPACSFKKKKPSDSKALDSMRAHINELLAYYQQACVNPQEYLDSKKQNLKHDILSSCQFWIVFESYGKDQEDHASCFKDYTRLVKRFKVGYKFKFLNKTGDAQDCSAIFYGVDKQHPERFSQDPFSTDSYHFYTLPAFLRDYSSRHQPCDDSTENPVAVVDNLNVGFGDYDQFGAAPVHPLYAANPNTAPFTDPYIQYGSELLQNYRDSVRFTQQHGFGAGTFKKPKKNVAYDYSTSSSPYVGYPSSGGSHTGYPSSSNYYGSYPWVGGSYGGSYIGYLPVVGSSTGYPSYGGSYSAYLPGESPAGYTSKDGSYPSYSLVSGSYSGYPSTGQTSASNPPVGGPNPGYPTTAGTYPGYISVGPSNAVYPSLGGSFSGFPRAGGRSVDYSTAGRPYTGYSPTGGSHSRYPSLGEPYSAFPSPGSQGSYPQTRHSPLDGSYTIYPPASRPYTGYSPLGGSYSGYPSLGGPYAAFLSAGSQASYSQTSGSSLGGLYSAYPPAGGTYTDYSSSTESSTDSSSLGEQYAYPSTGSQSSYPETSLLYASIPTIGTPYATYPPVGALYTEYPSTSSLYAGHPSDGSLTDRNYQPNQVYIVPAVISPDVLEAASQERSSPQDAASPTGARQLSHGEDIVLNSWALDVHDKKIAENLEKLFTGERKLGPLFNDDDIKGDVSTNSSRITRSGARSGSFYVGSRGLFDDQPESTTPSTVSTTNPPSPPPSPSTQAPQPSLEIPAPQVPIVVLELPSNNLTGARVVIEQAPESTVSTTELLQIETAPTTETITTEVSPLQATKPTITISSARDLQDTGVTKVEPVQVESAGPSLAQQVTENVTNIVEPLASSEALNAQRSAAQPQIQRMNESSVETTMTAPIPVTSPAPGTSAKPSGPMLISTDVETVIKDCKFWVILSPGAHEDKNAECHAKLDSLIPKYQANYKFGTVQSGAFSINLYLRNKAKPVEITRDDACDLKIIKYVLEAYKNETPGEWCVDPEDVSEEQFSKQQ